jgi:hypothetical protein
MTNKAVQRARELKRVQVKVTKLRFTIENGLADFAFVETYEFLYH